MNFLGFRSTVQVPIVRSKPQPPKVEFFSFEGDDQVWAWAPRSAEEEGEVLPQPWKAYPPEGSHPEFWVALVGDLKPALVLMSHPDVDENILYLYSVDNLEPRDLRGYHQFFLAGDKLSPYAA